MNEGGEEKKRRKKKKCDKKMRRWRKGEERMKKRGDERKWKDKYGYEKVCCMVAVNTNQRYIFDFRFVWKFKHTHKHNINVIFGIFVFLENKRQINSILLIFFLFCWFVRKKTKQDKKLDKS